MRCCALRSRRRQRRSTAPRRARRPARRRPACFDRRFAERRVAGLRKSRSRRRQHATSLEPGRRSSATYMPVIVNHYNVWPVFDVYANVDRRDLGGVGAEVRKIMREEEAHLPRGTSFDLRGQVETMQIVLLPPGSGHDLRRGAGVSADDGELPILAGSVHHPDGSAGRDGRHSVDAVRHRHHAQRALPDGRHHVHRRGDRQQHSDGDLRQRRARER